MICKDCDYVGRPTYDYPCSRCDITLGSLFCMYEHEEVPTNADKIRAMGDEELADFITQTIIKHINDAFYNLGIPQKVANGSKERAEKECLKWLKQPVEEYYEPNKSK